MVFESMLEYVMIYRLFSFRRCPYAIAARLALSYTDLQYELIEVNLRDKPPELFKVSPKGTVPVWVMSETVIDESADIVAFALNRVGMPVTSGHEGAVLIQDLLGKYLPAMHAFKYSTQPDQNNIDLIEQFLAQLDHRLSQHRYLMGSIISDCDIRVYPLVRQGAKIDQAWFSALPFSQLHRWMAEWDQEMILRNIMKKD